MIAFIARLARWLPVSGRIALRDASRNRAAAAPAVAAVMASVIGAMAAGIGTASAAAQNRANYVASLPQHDTYVRLNTHPEAVDPITAAVHRAIPDASVAVVDAAADDCNIRLTGSGPCTVIDAGRPRGYTSTRTWSSLLPDTIIDDGSALDAILGRHDPAAIAALRAGRTLVTDAAYLRAGEVTLESLRLANGVDAPSAPTTHRTVTVPGQALTHGFAGFQVIIPPRVAARLGVTPAAAGVLAATDTALSARQRQALSAALATSGLGLYFDTERGYSDRTLWLPLGMVAAAALIAVLAALIATALANVDSREDLTLLASIGASPHTRRVLSFSRAAVIAGIGTVIGAVAGVLPARAWVAVRRSAGGRSLDRGGDGGGRHSGAGGIIRVGVHPRATALGAAGLTREWIPVPSG